MNIAGVVALFFLLKVVFGDKKATETNDAQASPPETESKEPVVIN
jgi:hypothetical protein